MTPASQSRGSASLTRLVTLGTVALGPMALRAVALRAVALGAVTLGAVTLRTVALGAVALGAMALRTVALRTMAGTTGNDDAGCNPLLELLQFKTQVSHVNFTSLLVECWQTGVIVDPTNSPNGGRKSRANFSS